MDREVSRRSGRYGTSRSMGSDIAIKTALDKLGIPKGNVY